MQILFDNGTPYPIRPHLAPHIVATAYDLGWAVLKNGDLLRVAEEAGFDVFLTTDKSIQYQQNLKDRKLAIVVLDRSAWPRISGQVELIVSAIESCKPGDYKTVHFD